MVRITAWAPLAGIVAMAAGLIACGAPQASLPAEFGAGQSTESPIAGTILPCPGDYPDSRLVFVPDGTLGGRYAGGEVTGEWSAIGPGQVAVLVRAGGLAVRDTLRRTGQGWRGEVTACG